MANLIELGCRDEQGNLRIVIETPCGSRAKIKYDPLLGIFELQRFIASTGYPYDWGFVSSTLAEDGDPLDAMVIADSHTWPGVVISCVSVELLKLVEAKAGETQTRHNDRLICMPVASLVRGARAELRPETRLLLERFFVATGELAHKRVTLAGWGSKNEADDAVTRAAAAYEAKRRAYSDEPSRSSAK